MSREYVHLTDHQRSLLTSRIARLDRLRRAAQAEQEAVRELLVAYGGADAGWDRERGRLYVETSEEGEGGGRDTRRPPLR